MGGGGGTNTVSEKSDPWVGQQPYLTKLYAEAEKAYDATPKTGYGGQTLAPVNWNQAQGLNIGKDVAEQTIPQGMQQIQGMINQAPQFKFANPTQWWAGNQTWNEQPQQFDLNSYVGQVVDQTSNAAGRAFQRQVMPSITSQAISQGAYGGGRKDISEGVAAGEFDRNAREVASQIGMQAFENVESRRATAIEAEKARRFGTFTDSLGRDFDSYQQVQDQAFRGAQNEFDTNARSELARYAMTPGLVQQMVQMAGQRGEIFSGIGDVERGWQQQQLDDALARYTMNSQAPWNGLPQFASTVAGAFPGGQTTQTSPDRSASRAQGAITGAMGGAALGGSLAAIPALGISGPIGLGAGALLGLLGGALA